MRWVTLLLVSPLAGAMPIALLPADRLRLIRLAALFAPAATLTVAWAVLGGFDPGLMHETIQAIVHDIPLLSLLLISLHVNYIKGVGNH